MIKDDIATILKDVPLRILAENLDPTKTTPEGFDNWGDWIIDTASLDKNI